MLYRRAPPAPRCAPPRMAAAVTPSSLCWLRRLPPPVPADKLRRMSRDGFRAPAAGVGDTDTLRWLLPLLLWLPPLRRRAASRLAAVLWRPLPLAAAASGSASGWCDAEASTASSRDSLLLPRCVTVAMVAPVPAGCSAGRVVAVGVTVGGALARPLLPGRGSTVTTTEVASVVLPQAPPVVAGLVLPFPTGTRRGGAPRAASTPATTVGCGCCSAASWAPSMALMVSLSSEDVPWCDDGTLRVMSDRMGTDAMRRNVVLRSAWTICVVQHRCGETPPPAAATSPQPNGPPHRQCHDVPHRRWGAQMACRPSTAE